MHLLSFNKYFIFIVLTTDSFLAVKELTMALAVSALVTAFRLYMSQGQALWLPVKITPRPQLVKPHSTPPCIYLNFKTHNSGMREKNKSQPPKGNWPHVE